MATLTISLRYAQQAFWAIEDVKRNLSENGVSIESTASDTYEIETENEDIDVEYEISSILESAGIPSDEYSFE